MNVLVLCEFSDTVSSAFRRYGAANVFSNDLLPTEGDSKFHIQGDCFEAIDKFKKNVGNIDLIIMHPPCTALAVSGNSTYGKGKPKHHKLSLIHI